MAFSIGSELVYKVALESADSGDKRSNLFQRVVRKLMICEHGVEYQVVDDLGGDGGLDGFINRALAIYMRSIVRKNHWPRAFGRNLRMTLKGHANSVTKDAIPLTVRLHNA